MYYTIRQMSERHPAFTIKSLENLVYKAEKNGLLPAIKRVGMPDSQRKRVYINELMFLRWIEDQSSLIREENKKLSDQENLIGKKIGENKPVKKCNCNHDRLKGDNTIFKQNQNNHQQKNDINSSQLSLFES